MRRTAWMLLLGCLVGCSKGSTPLLEVKAPQQQQSSLGEIVVPKEVEGFIAQGAFAQVIETLNGLIEKSPQDDSLYSLRASSHFHVGHFDEAFADVTRAIELKPNDARLYNNRGFMRMSKEQYQEADADFAHAVTLCPQYKNAFNNRGLLRLAQRRFDEAIEEFNHALEIDNRYLDAYNNRGYAELEAGQLVKALDDFNIAIELNPEYVNGYTNRGLLRFQAGDYENAVLDFTQAMIIDPMNPRYYEMRREAYRKQGEYRKEIEDERKIGWLMEYHQLTAEIAASLEPVEELVERAKHFVEARNLDKALEDLNRALQLDSHSVLALVTRADVHLRRKAVPQALTDAQAALAIRPSEEVYSVLGDIHLAQKDYGQALESFNRAHRADEAVAEAYYGQSKILSSQGQEEQAKNQLEQALALDPDIESRLR